MRRTGGSTLVTNIDDRKVIDAVREARMAFQAGDPDFKHVLSAKGMEAADRLQDAGADSISQIEIYMKHLQSKYGNVRIESIPKDQQSLERAGKQMSGNDVVIAPNILVQMANDPETAAYYEQKIDWFFQDIPKQSALCAAKGLVYEPCGVVVHEDGTVTYICGCSDSPERVAEVNAINKAKQEKRARMRRAALERSLESAEQQRLLLEYAHEGQAVLRSRMSSAAASYEHAVSVGSGSILF